ncbi:TetR/AcrR family transcriptional regulator [Streptomyces sp. NPDC047014]|uniref:TetR/AcrR family transcriptional regulator n=1 Tax=Streptomyces sp. NPDC047014 TaxID=3155736 RepID=UPI0033D0F4C8
MSDPSTPRPARGRPPRLDQARTVETALTLLDGSGLDALTMRRLADALGVQAGALYRYFRTKEDLLTAMAERIMAGIDAPTGAADWRDRLTGLAGALRQALLAHRDGARVFAGTHSTGPATLGFAETCTGVLREAGFSDADAARTMVAVVHFTVGHTLEEQAVGEGEGGLPADPEVLRGAVSSGAYPHLTAALPTLTDPDYAPHFEFGLALLMSGIEARARFTRRGPC